MEREATALERLEMEEGMREWRPETPALDAEAAPEAALPEGRGSIIRHFACTVAVQVLAGPWVLAILKVLIFAVLMLVFRMGDGASLLNPMTIVGIGMAYARRWFGVFLAIGICLAVLRLLLMPAESRLRDRRGMIVTEVLFFVVGAAAWGVLAPSEMIGFATPRMGGGPESATALLLGGIATLVCRRIDTAVYGVVGGLRPDPFEELDDRDGWIARSRDSTPLK